ncbi:MAG TPA: hypothetical protein VJB57_10820 [Dehalococcoidia bacterium]|nr:hypothetical protein [Dehalococcoidia bacterium]
MTIKTPSDAEAEGPVASSPERDDKPKLSQEIDSVIRLREQLIKKLFVPSNPDGSWASLPATN